MISSAGSLSKSKDLIERQMSSVRRPSLNARQCSGQLRMVQVELDAANSESLAISQRTIAEMLQVSLGSKARSRGAKSSVKAYRGERECRDSAFHLTSVVKIFPLILILPLRLPIKLTLSV